LLEVQNAEILTAAERTVIYRQVLDVRSYARDLLRIQPEQKIGLPVTPKFFHGARAART